MAVFSTNQVRHLFVNTTDHPVTFVTPDEGKTGYFTHQGVAGMVRSDLIDLKSASFKFRSAESLRKPIYATRVSLNPDIHTDTVVAGQDYILRIAFRNYIGLSEEDQYFKYGMVHAVSGMSLTRLYKEMLLSLLASFTGETTKLLKFFVVIAGEDDPIEVTDKSVVTSIDDDASILGIDLIEAEQDWILGTMSRVPVNFTAQIVPITYNGEDRFWGIVTEKVPTNIVYGNGKDIADLEYFCMGERGDIYRFIGFPNSFRTTYLVDSTQEYDVIDVTFSFTGEGEDPQGSRKVMTIVGTDLSNLKDAIEDVIEGGIS